MDDIPEKKHSALHHAAVGTAKYAAGYTGLSIAGSVGLHALAGNTPQLQHWKRSPIGHIKHGVKSAVNEHVQAGKWAAGGIKHHGGRALRTIGKTLGRFRK